MKKWFLTQHEELFDLNSAKFITIEKEGNYHVVFADSLNVLGIFETVREAKEYVKKIHLYLVAQ